MKIKHRETNIEISLSFGDWISEYVRKDLYKDWEVLNLENVVKVIFLKKDGKVSKTLMSKGVAEKHKNQFNGVNGISVKIEKGIVSKEFYQEYLQTKILKRKDYSNLSFIKKIKKSIPSIKKIKHKIINSTTSKWLGKLLFSIFVTVFGGIILLIIWRLYENELINLWNKYI
ncbi:hypothetical protein K8354_16150 [Polaribacter litorisediminis]|uniref:hypothetical protein n=1 Tax=Polaribacter litorisediminis TaxID=1908341 RepID=UPI001CC03383|nr:hypothetical protein [Polaribacter litorisediminis]UAM97802.1 hypothetical protein K8354_16150 [Polaribacter litorisediminis]